MSIKIKKNNFLVRDKLNTVKESKKYSKIDFFGGDSINEVTDDFSITVKNNIIYFNGGISKKSCISLRKAILEAVYNTKKLGLTLNIKPLPVELHIESDGGDMYSAFSIVTLINNLDVDIYSYIDSYAGSAGTIISVSCKKKFMYKYSFMLIHQLSSGLSYNKYDKLVEEMENKKDFMNTIKQIYIENTKIKEKDLNNILKKDLWFNSAKCLELGLVDEII
jgi:ATP-dependent protease ClpP protease subunit